MVNPSKAVAQHFPHLGRGILAAERRASSEYNEFDGRVVARPALDPTSPEGPVLSASGLEYLGRCPIAYFFRYVLGVSPPDELLVDADRWLDPMATGSLLHEVFREFLAVCVKRELLPDFERDQTRLFKILNRWIARIDAASSSPPHIHPPIAHVPRPTTDASMPDCPNGRFRMIHAPMQFAWLVAVTPPSAACRPDRR